MTTHDSSLITHHSSLVTACNDWHKAHKGRMVDFAGWEMPVQYSTITEEHHAVRTAAGLFDIAHMGRVRFSGPDACRFLDQLVTNDITKLEVGQIRYALVTNEQGGILDDVLVYRFESFYLLVVNASNRMKILSWIKESPGSFDVHYHDWTIKKFMLALQGPKAIEILNPLVDADLSQIKYYGGTETTVQGEPAIVTRTGYTGEDGFEVIVSSDYAPKLWETLIEAGQSLGLLPAGLGCRDTLRLEAAMPLYGHELNESIDPFTAGLSFAVKLKAGNFLGKDALIDRKAADHRQQRIGLELDCKRIARAGAMLFSGDEQIGQVTSGTFSPTLKKSIAMGYIKPQFAKTGTKLEVDIRGKRHTATVVELPFYSRK
ncbi:MAG: glycine cleavage system aminomethyltransferase GcvT [Planctomycetes bacterium]|nr:glycine cleavage system aminomethyltransferase GcvT [Planctomycetota bacterium]